MLAKNSTDETRLKPSVPATHGTAFLAAKMVKCLAVANTVRVHIGRNAINQSINQSMRTVWQRLSPCGNVPQCPASLEMSGRSGNVFQ
jgi:hypothetical protein